MEQFTFYELYADILQGMDDVHAGKLASSIVSARTSSRTGSLRRSCRTKSASIGATLLTF